MKKVFSIILVFGFLEILLTPPAYAFNIEAVEGVGIGNDFVVGPAKLEVDVKPGQELSQDIYTINRVGTTTEFEVSVEDFIGDPKDVTKFLGDAKSAFSCKEWFSPEKNSFYLEQGEKAQLNIKIKVPENADAGDHYAAVFVSAKREGGGAINFASRVGVLFLVTVDGQQVKEGKLGAFSTDKVFYQNEPIKFNLLFINQGTVHLKPEGFIEVKNFFGQQIIKFPIEDWWVLREVTRAKEIIFNHKNLFGFYTANLVLNRGYAGLQDVKKISFWVIPWKKSLITLLIFIMIILILLWVKRYIQKLKMK